MVAGIGEAPWLEIVQHWHDRFMRESTVTAVTVPLRVTVTADLARAKGENSPALWLDAIDAWEEGSTTRPKHAGALPKRSSRQIQAIPTSNRTSTSYTT